MKWPIVKLGDVCTFTSGGTPSKDIVDFWRGEIPWISSADIVNDVIQKPRHYLSNSALNSSSTNLVPPGTLLAVTRTGVGKVAITDFDLCFSQDITALHLDANCYPKYIAYALKVLSSSLIAQARGATIKGITRTVLASLRIPLPPLAEQKRIAAILDKAEEIRRKREEAVEKLDQLAQSVFLEITKREQCKKIRLKDLVKKKKLDKPNHRLVWSLSLEDIERNIGEVNQKTYVEWHSIGTSTFYFEQPVVLYSKLRPNLNKVVIPDENGCATTELVPLYCDESLIRPSFLASYLRTTEFVAFATTNSAGAKMPRVIMEKFWEHEVAVPSMATQLVYEEIYYALRREKKLFKTALSQASKLFSASQHQAFTTGFDT